MRTLARERDLGERLTRRAARAGVALAPAIVPALGEYLTLLARWNRKINLTSLDVDAPSDEAIDRLILEPIAAAAFMPKTARVLVDLGSGGGSPAIPLEIACSHLRLVMVESKVRKSAFLREAIRTLALDHAEVENRRFEELLVQPAFHGIADVVSIRAVKLDEKTLGIASFLLAAPSGRLWRFHSAESESSLPFGWQPDGDTRVLLQPRTSQRAISKLDILEPPA